MQKTGEPNPVVPLTAKVSRKAANMQVILFARKAALPFSFSSLRFHISVLPFYYLSTILLCLDVTHLAAVYNIQPSLFYSIYSKAIYLESIILNIVYLGLSYIHCSAFFVDHYYPF